MRDALKEIAGFYNESLDPQDSGQAAAIRARATLEELGLFFQKDAAGPSGSKPQGTAEA